MHAGAALRFQRAHIIRSAGVAGMANFKIYLLRQFCSNRVDFLQYTGDTDAKNDGPEF